jgi:hypothetical protein
MSTTYRLFLVDERGNVVDAGPLEASDDSKVVALALTVDLGARSLEIWSGERFVALLPRMRGSGSSTHH